MIRVTDLEKSLTFYSDILGMRLLHREDYTENRFTLAFIGYDDESAHTVIELTYNWDRSDPIHGNTFGHLALAVADIYATSEMLEQHGVDITRAPGPMAFPPKGKDKTDVIAFIKDPDGYQIELIERN